ncbi:MAG: DUF4468 domain-containing protein [Candidatus Kuenenia stuttgartiensis]|nr:DUF4468 domain-containing protein [Candidatus Kuenenia stuttgartiensis]
MKRYVTIVLLVFLVGPVLAQTLPVHTVTNKVGYGGMLDIPGQSKDKLFAKAKKWLAIKHSDANPYTITYENETEGGITGKGSFTLPAEERKYTVQFLITIATKDGKCKYEFTDFMIRYTTAGGMSTGGFSYWSSSSYNESETLEYTLETFYPIRLEKRKKPAIKWYEHINAKSFEAIDREMRAIESSLKQTMSAQTNW